MYNTVKATQLFSQNSARSISFIDYYNSRGNIPCIIYRSLITQQLKLASRYSSFAKKHNFSLARNLSSAFPLPLVNTLSFPQCVGMRSYCSNQELPQLMDFPQVVWPSVFKTMRNWILSNFIIMRYFDPEFRLSEFINASNKVPFTSFLIACSLLHVAY